MQKIINNRKYDTETAELLAIRKNRWLRKYEAETEREYLGPDGTPIDWNKAEPPMLDEPPFIMEVPSIKDPDDEELDFDWTNKDDPKDDPEDPSKGGTDLEEDDDDDFTFLSVVKPLADDFNFDDPIPKPEEGEDDEDEEEEDDPNEDGSSEEDPNGPEDEPIKPDEDSATEDEEIPSEPRLSPMWQAELLYRKPNGKYFLLGVGGGASDYWDKQNSGEFTPFDSEVEAKNWAVDHLPVPIVEEIFGCFCD